MFVCVCVFLFFKMEGNFHLLIDLTLILPTLFSKYLNSTINCLLPFVAWFLFRQWNVSLGPKGDSLSPAILCSAVFSSAARDC